VARSLRGKAVKAAAGLCLAVAVSADVGLARARGQPLVIRTYSQAAVPQYEMDRARTSAVDSLDRAGIAVIWLDCTVRPNGQALDPCAVPLGAREVVVRILKAAANSTPNSLGFAYVDVDRGRGVLATVYADRVRMLAAAANVDSGSLMGRTIAHEVAHLLLGTTAHSARGLMRGRWEAADVRRARQGDWWLSAGEGRRMRSELVSRARQARAPDMTLAQLADWLAGHLDESETGRLDESGKGIDRGWLRGVD
jgi:hypothetical protein